MRLGPGHPPQQPSVETDVRGDEAHQGVHAGRRPGAQLVALGNRRVDADAVGARERGGVDAESARGLEDTLAAGDPVGLRVVGAARVRRQGEEASGICSIWPTLMSSGAAIRLASSSAATVVPWRTAMSEAVSPGRTT